MRKLAVLFFTVLLHSLTGQSLPAVQEQKSAKDSIYFEDRVQPIFKRKCIGCHNATDLDGGLDLSNRRAILAGGDSGMVLPKGQQQESQDELAHQKSSLRGLLWKKIQAKEMPPEDSPPLNASELNGIQTWLETGAAFRGDAGSASVTAERIIPLLHLRCGKCHGATQQEGNLDLRTLEGVLKGGQSGPAAIAGKAAESLMIQRIDHGEMPPKKRIVPDSVKSMTDAELELLRQWVDDGFPAAPVRQLKRRFSSIDREFWAFQPPQRPRLPVVGKMSQAENPIDGFLLARLERSGLDFSHRLSRQKLIRRLSFDLRGLPPDPDEVASFMADTRSDALEHLVDRMLLSPAVGENWATLWLDAVGYADSEGGQNEDRVRPNMWRYRDYVIQAFSEDKPISQFFVEQLAGDELHDYQKPGIAMDEEVYGALVATGFLRTTPDRTFQNITNFVPDRLDVIADEIQVLGSSMLGLTVHCARCHTHKFDPLSQLDYFRMAAVLKDGFDEHDWLKPENRNLTIPVDQLSPSLPGTIRAGATEKEISIRALWSRGRPSPTFLLRRGNHLTPGPLVQPGVPEILQDPLKAPGELPWHSLSHRSPKTGRRLAFAKWLTNPDHPLTSRVFVNRIWDRLFGHGIVATLDNFGKTGAPPTHPDLLDWLSVEFVEGHWSLKQILRTMVLSHAYQQVSEVSQESKKADPDNRLYSRMPLKRMRAETVRDSILAVTGQLSNARGGPPIQVVEKENGLILASELPGGGWCRSVYVIHRRTKIPTLLDSFDYPQMGPNCVVRKNSIVPQQALHLTNNQLVQSWCQSLANEVASHPGSFDQQMELLFHRVLARGLEQNELVELKKVDSILRAQWRQHLGLESDDDVVRIRALTNICHSLINSAGFLYID
jgi:hypothetical protein